MFWEYLGLKEVVLIHYLYIYNETHSVNKSIFEIDYSGGKNGG